MFNTLKQDIKSVFDRDPAARTAWEILVCYPGLHALWFYRASHWLWTHDLRTLGRWVAHWGRWLTGIEIHPGAQIGPGLFIDHGMGVVIGETAVVGAYVTLYHGVTLGGVSWRKEKRHPTLGDHVVVGAGAKILGPITVGDYSRIGANSVVVKDVAANSVVVGVPGRISAQNGERVQARDHQHEDLRHDQIHDVTMERIQTVNDRLAQLEAQMARFSGQYDEEEGLMVEAYMGPWGI